MAAMITHSCGAMWTSTRAAHCASCHETFGGVSGFEKHRRNLQCIDPATLGLVLVEQEQGVSLWRRPAPVFAEAVA